MQDVAFIKWVQCKGPAKHLYSAKLRLDVGVNDDQKLKQFGLISLLHVVVILKECVMTYNLRIRADMGFWISLVPRHAWPRAGSLLFAMLAALSYSSLGSRHELERF